MLVSVVESMQKRQEPKFKASDKLVGSRGAPWAPSAVDSGGVAVADGVAARALRSAGGVVPAAPSLAALAASEMSDVDDGLAATSLPPPLNARRACRLSDSLRIAVPSVRAVWPSTSPLKRPCWDQDQAIAIARAFTSAGVPPLQINRICQLKNCQLKNCIVSVYKSRHIAADAGTKITAQVRHSTHVCCFFFAAS